jgi:CheY-like chemotaxis protein
VEAEHADKLRNAWGDKPCSHAMLEREHHLGLFTGFYACAQCGHAIWWTDSLQLFGERSLGAPRSLLFATEVERSPDWGEADVASSARTRFCILVVDDHQDARIIYGKSIEYAGFRVILARDGNDALVIVEEFLPDLIVLDLALPKLDGWAVARRLKAGIRTRDIPIIALTGHAEPENRERALEAGCALFLTKPCQPDALVDAIERLLQDSSAALRPES